MKKTTLVTILFLQCILLFGQGDTIYGPIQSVREHLEYYEFQPKKNTFYSSDYGEFGIISPEKTAKRFKYVWYNASNSLYINYYKQFHENRKPQKEIWFDKRNDTLRTHIYLYDKNDNLIQDKLIYDSSSILYNNRNYQGNRILTSHSFWTENPNEYDLIIYKTDSMGKILELQKINESGRVAVTKIEYDSLNRKHKIFKNSFSKFFNRELVLSEKYNFDYLISEYRYDSLNKLTEEKSFNPILHKKVSEYRGKVSCVYDKQGRLISQYKYSKTNELSYSENTIYENQIKIVTRKSEVSPQYSWSKEYFYDEKGNLKKLIYKTHQKEYNINFKQSFDKYGNWTQQIKSVNGKKMYKWIRELKYYTN